MADHSQSPDDTFGDEGTLKNKGCNKVSACISPLPVHRGGAGVLWWVVGWGWYGGNKLIKVQCLVEDGSMWSHAVGI